MTAPGDAQCPLTQSVSATVAPDGLSFSGTVIANIPRPVSGCASFPFPVGGSRCGNSIVEPNEECDDGVFCSGDDTCAGGTCSAHAGDPCAARPTCQRTCIETSAQCLSPPGTPCDDGVFCNGADSCSAAGGCAVHAGDPCIGQPECHACNENSDRCASPPGTACADDGQACTADRCDGAGACEHPLLPSGTACRAAAAACDAAESCDGVAPACPPDGLQPTGSPCGTCRTCDAGGVCVDAPRPPGTCKRPVQPSAASLELVNKDPDTKDRLSWTWKKGDATTVAQFGDPVGGDGYALCLFDASAPDSALVLSARAAAAGWTAGSKGFKYKRRSLDPDGLRSASLVSGSAGRAKATVRGSGDALLLPAAATPVQLPLLVQLQNDRGACWEARFSSATRNDGTELKAKSD